MRVAVMLRRAAIVAAPALALAVAGTVAHAGSAGPAQLPDLPLAEFSNALVPGSVADDRGIDLGGIGSDLFPASRPGEFWTVTDRGPNGQIKVGKEKRRTFPVPGFSPAIVRVRASGAALTVVQAIPITGRGGKPVTGLPNQPGRDEAPYSFDASTALGFNPDGLDTEGIVRAIDGTFWLVDEYGPSLVHVASNGRVLTRYVPRGLGLTGTSYPVRETLPAVLLNRQTNRGFEGIAKLPGGDLLLAVQSPLALPDTATGKSSRIARFVRFSPLWQRVTAEYAYQLEPVDVIDPSADGDQSEVKISALVPLGWNRLLVQERTDKAARLYAVDLCRATNVLGTPWDDAATAPSLEQLTDLAAAGVRPPAKRLAIDLETVPGMLDKIEGVALARPGVLAVINDNDFGMTDGPGAFDAAGRLVDSGIETRLTYVPLP